MKSKGILKGFGLLVLGSFLYISPARAAEKAPTEKVEMSNEARRGKQYFEGSRRFKNGGPACITCHNVTNDKLIPGGLLAKDLTDVYPKYGEVLPLWLVTPDNAPMTTAYQNHQLEEDKDNPEKSSLAAFLKYADEVKDDQTAQSGYDLFYIGGGVGLLGILIVISLLWMKRKKQMVKKDIFARQNSAWDAKH